MNSAGWSNISSIFQHGLQDGYLSLNPHVKGGLFPLKVASFHVISKKTMSHRLYTTVGTVQRRQSGMHQIDTNIQDRQLFFTFQGHLLEAVSFV